MNIDKEKIIDTIIKKDLFGFNLYIDLIKDNIDIPLDDEGNTALIYSVLYNKVKLLNILLKNRSNINALNKSNDGALTIALKNGYIDILKVLLDHLIKFDNYYEKGVSILKYILSSKHSIYEMLIRNPNIDYVKEREIATHNSDLTVIKYILNKKSTLSYNINEKSMFINAIKNKNNEMIRWCVEKGYDINFKFDDGSSLLMSSIISNLWQSVELLIENNAPITYNEYIKLIENSNIEEIKSIIPRIQKSVNIEVLKEFINQKDYHNLSECLQKQLNLNNVNKLLIYAVNKNDLIAVKILIESGADLNYCDNTNKPPLIIAIIKGHCQMFKLIMQERSSLKHYKVEIVIKNEYNIIKLSDKINENIKEYNLVIDSKDELEEYIKILNDNQIYYIVDDARLFDAVIRDDEKLVDRLLNDTTQKNILNNNYKGMPILFYALKSSSLMALEKLLQHGANPNTIIEYEEVIFIEFSLNNYKKIKLLLAYGAKSDKMKIVITYYINYKVVSIFCKDKIIKEYTVDIEDEIDKIIEKNKNCKIEIKDLKFKEALKNNNFKLVAELLEKYQEKIDWVDICYAIYSNKIEIVKMILNVANKTFINNYFEVCLGLYNDYSTINFKNENIIVQEKGVEYKFFISSYLDKKNNLFEKSYIISDDECFRIFFTDLSINYKIIDYRIIEAAKNNKWSLIEKLLSIESTAEFINMIDNKGYSALYYAVRSSNEIITEKLILKGASVNLKFNDFEFEEKINLLFISIVNEIKFQCVKLLIDYGIRLNDRVNYENFKNIDVLGIALLNKKNRIAEYLLEKKTGISLFDYYDDSDSDNIISIKKLSWIELLIIIGNYDRKYYEMLLKSGIDINRNVIFNWYSVEIDEEMKQSCDDAGDIYMPEGEDYITSNSISTIGLLIIMNNFDKFLNIKKTEFELDFEVKLFESLKQTGNYKIVKTEKNTCYHLIELFIAYGLNINNIIDFEIIINDVKSKYNNCYELAKFIDKDDLYPFLTNLKKRVYYVVKETINKFNNITPLEIDIKKFFISFLSFYKDKIDAKDELLKLGLINQDKAGNIFKKSSVKNFLKMMEYFNIHKFIYADNYRVKWSLSKDKYFLNLYDNISGLTSLNDNNEGRVFKKCNNIFNPFMIDENRGSYYCEMQVSEDTWNYSFLKRLREILNNKINIIGPPEIPTKGKIYCATRIKGGFSLQMYSKYTHHKKVTLFNIKSLPGKCIPSRIVTFYSSLRYSEAFQDNPIGLKKWLDFLILDIGISVNYLEINGNISCDIEEIEKNVDKLGKLIIELTLDQCNYF